MNILFYGSTGNTAAKKLLKTICMQVPPVKIEKYNEIDSLSERLRQFSKTPPIIVILITNLQELSALIAVQSLLSDIRIIIILPDRKKDTVAKGFKLYPRFVSYADSDFTDIAAVLAKMLNAKTTLSMA